MLRGIANNFDSNSSKGVASIVKFSLSQEDVKWANLRAAVNYEPWFMRVSEGNYVKLYVDGVMYEIWDEVYENLIDAVETLIKEKRFTTNYLES